jgi:hypothetical protein
MEELTMNEALQAQLDAITCHLEGLSATVGALRLNLANLHRELAWRRIAPAPGPEDDPAELALEISRLRQQLAGFRFESHQEHQELYHLGRDSAVNALIDGCLADDCTVSAAAEASDAVLLRERSFTVPICEPGSETNMIDPVHSDDMVAGSPGSNYP